MNPPRAFYLKMLLQKHHKGTLEQAVQLLPTPSREAVLKSELTEAEASHAFHRPGELLSKIHYSWVADALTKKIDENKRIFYLSSLPPQMQLQVAKLLNFQGDIVPLKGPLQQYVQKQLLLKMLPKGYLPVAYLPKTPLKPLLSLSKAKVVELVDYLGLFDLAEELKKIVHTKLIKGIYASLQPQELEFLRACLHQKEKLQTPRFPLNDWNGESKELHFRIHKRGLLRLAKALVDQSPSFLWHLTRMLDTGRGRRLETLMPKESPPQVTQVMQEQVLQLLKFLEKGSKQGSRL